MIRKQLGTLSWLESELLQPFPYVQHGCFLCPPSTSTPLSYEQIATALFGSSQTPLIAMQQVHGKNVVILTSPKPPEMPCDGLATALPNIGLCVRHADCQACLFFDPEHRVVANVHSGWQGSVQNIYKEAVERLRDRFETRPETLIACIGPSLGPCHAEFRNWKEELPPSFAPFQCQEEYFNFWEISRHQLLSLGLRSDHIEIAGLCTYCRPDLFFSYRRNKTAERNITCIGMVEPLQEALSQ